MSKHWMIAAASVLLLWTGCTEKDEIAPPPEEEKPINIYRMQYAIDDLCLKDHSLAYDLTGNWDHDFWLSLKWEIDSSLYDYKIRLTHRYAFYNHLGGYSNFNTSLDRPWAEGDTVIQKEGQTGWISESSGAYLVGTNHEETFRLWIDSVQTTQHYWGFYLRMDQKKHFGWLRMRCGTIEELAFNLDAEEPIIMGQ
ncbi:MAG: hypothetical protein ACK4VN_08345 [Bacteroidales bacterium]